MCGKSVTTLKGINDGCICVESEDAIGSDLVGLAAREAFVSSASAPINSPHRYTSDCDKVGPLTLKEFLPLARSVIDPSMTLEERLEMLAVGTIVKYNELLNCDLDSEIDVGGEVLWHAEQLLDEIDSPGEALIRKLAACAIDAVEDSAGNNHGLLLEHVRAENIKKLMRLYPDSFVEEGGVNV